MDLLIQINFVLMIDIGFGRAPVFDLKYTRANQIRDLQKSYAGVIWCYTKQIKAKGVRRS
jgi:hypothetical protein